MSEREMTGAEIVAALVPARSAEPTTEADEPPASTASEAAPEPNPEAVESGGDGAEFTDMASALRGQSQAAKRGPSQ